MKEKKQNTWTRSIVCLDGLCKSVRKLFVILSKIAQMNYSCKTQYDFVHHRKMI